MNKIYQKSTLAPLKRFLHTAYVVQPKIGTLEQEKQACYLTKTLMVDGAPTKIKHQNEEESHKLVQSVRDAIIETMFFQRDEGLKFPKRMKDGARAYKLKKYKAEISSKILSNLLRVVWSSESAK